MGNWGKLKATILVLLLTVSGCGGGGGSSDSTQKPDPPPVDPPPSTPTRADLVDASRLASHATFGLNYQDIYAMAEQGLEEWLDEQLSMPYSSHVKIATELIGRREAGEFEGFENRVQFPIVFWRAAWWNRIMTQRISYASVSRLP